MTATVIAIGCLALTLGIVRTIWHRTHGPEWRDQKAAIRNLDIRNGWIVERGRDQRIIMLHCGHCGHIKRGVDSTRDRAVGDALITLITRKPCPHAEKEVQP